MYKERKGNKAKLPFLYRTLRRFETSRYELTYQLAAGGQSLLDIGCGEGELIQLLKGKYQEIWGIDIAGPRIERVQKEFVDEPNIHVTTADANEHLNFDDASFDTIIAIAILEHVFDPYHFVRECHRLLKKDGQLIAQVPNVAFLPNRVKMLTGRLPVTSGEIGWDGGHLHYFTRTALKDLCSKQGFKVVNITSGGIFAKMRRIWGSLLGADIFIAAVKQ